MDNLTKQEISFLKKLNTPNKIQDFLDSIPFNFEEKGETVMSPRRVMREKKAHCIEGAFFASSALMVNGEKPLVMNLKITGKDFDHCVALFKKNGYWGAISKTNHAVLRFRDPIYKTIRELALSYFHEYFLLTDGKKTLRGYTSPIDMNKFGKSWMTEEKDLWGISSKIFYMKHIKIIPDKNKKYIRNASEIERKSAGVEEWKKNSKKR